MSAQRSTQEVCALEEKTTVFQLFIFISASPFCPAYILHSANYIFPSSNFNGILSSKFSVFHAYTVLTRIYWIPLCSKSSLESGAEFSSFAWNWLLLFCFGAPNWTLSIRRHAVHKTWKSTIRCNSLATECCNACVTLTTLISSPIALRFFGAFCCCAKTLLSSARLQCIHAIWIYIAYRTQTMQKKLANFNYSLERCVCASLDGFLFRNIF